MAKIYEENQVTPIYNSTGEPAIAKYSENVKAYGREMDAEAQQQERQAKQTYSTALKIGATETMNQLYQQYPDDPVKLQAEFKKAYDKTIGEIADDDVKVDFMANASLQSQTYITKAIDNKKKKDYRIAKSMTFDGINKNTDKLGFAFSTLLGDNFDSNSVGTYNSALAENDAMINKLNEDGTFMFTDEQRKRMVEDMEKAHLVALRQNFDGMNGYEKDSYMKLLDADAIEVPVGVDKEGNIVKKNLKDVVSYESYEKFRDYAEKVYARRKKIMEKNGIIGKEEADAIAEEQQVNFEQVKGVFKNIEKTKKDGDATGSVIETLELLDVLSGMGEDKLAKKENDEFQEKARDILNETLKNKAKDFDETGFDSALSTALQILKNDGKIASGAWSDKMSVVMMRDFYAMAKEEGLDLRANDSGSRAAAKNLASKAISNAIEMEAGGHRAKANSIYLYGRKVTKQPIKKDAYVNKDYFPTGDTKQYIETGINLIPFESTNRGV